ncbi:hypothetical protein [Rubrivivax sp. JA1026]|uniref:hypothetical protein n=1 Tax=Rubrivivax sp. JA1026 TaxID=2710888 RepID=UPI0013E9740D|nr:hypothetical protein [Rubrivivax sp. JA1026]
MPNLFVRSSDGSDSDSGASWELAKATSAGAAAIDAAGDTIFFWSTHSESGTTNLTLNFAGTVAAPVRLVSTSDASAVPTSVSPGAQIGTQADNPNAEFTIDGSVRAYGMTFRSGGALTLARADGVQEFWGCSFQVRSSYFSSPRLFIGTEYGNPLIRVVWNSCTVFLANGSTFLDICSGGLEWNGGAFLAGTGTPNPVMRVRARSQKPTRIIGVDMTALSWSANLCELQVPGLVQFIGCKLPASWVGALWTGTRRTGGRIEMLACDSGGDIRRDQVAELAGDLYTETSIKPAGVEKTWRMVKAANALTLDSLQIKFPLSAGTRTIEIDTLTDGLTLTDAEISVDLAFAGSAASTLYSLASDAPANPLSPAAQASSSTTWATAGVTSPVRQTLGVTVYVGQDCVGIATVRLTRASTTVYVCPVPRVT